MVDMARRASFQDGAVLSPGAQGQVWGFPCVCDTKYEFLKSAMHTVVVQVDQARARLRVPLAVPWGPGSI